MIKAREELRKKFLEPKKDIDCYLQARKKPMDPRLLMESFPQNFRVPLMEAYEGAIDSNDHINMFLAQMVVQLSLLLMLCCVICF